MIGPAKVCVTCLPKRCLSRCYATWRTNRPRVPSGATKLKFDGDRAIGFRSEGRARLWSRNGKDFVRQFPEVAKAIAPLPEDTAIDGEIVALDVVGKPSFALLQGSGAGAAPSRQICRVWSDICARIPATYDHVQRPLSKRPALRSSRGMVAAGSPRLLSSRLESVSVEHDI